MRTLRANSSTSHSSRARPSRFAQAVTELVQAAISFIPQVEEKGDKEELITALKTVTDGKVRGTSCAAACNRQSNRLRVL